MKVNTFDVLSLVYLSTVAQYLLVLGEIDICNVDKGVIVAIFLPYNAVHAPL